MIYAELIARARTLAEGTGLDPSQSPVLDGEMTAEAIYPHAVRYVVARALSAGGASPADFVAEHVIDIANGVGALPDGVLRKFLPADAYLIGHKAAAWVPYGDYLRDKHTGLTAYFATRGTQFLYAPVSREYDTAVMTAGSADFTTSASAHLTDSDLGRRITVRKPNGVLVIDSILDSRIGTTDGTCRGRALDTIASGGTLTIRDTTAETQVRTFGNVSIAEDDNEVSAAGAAFSAADVGRRLTVDDGGVIIVDAYITSVIGATSARLSANAVQSTVGSADATVYKPAVTLAAVSAPEAPADPDDPSGLSESLALSVIVTIAAVLKGEMPLAALMEQG